MKQTKGMLGASALVFSAVIGFSGWQATDAFAQDRQMRDNPDDEMVIDLELPEEEEVEEAEETEEVDEGGDDDLIGELALLFEGSSIIAGPELVDCTLSGGTETTCFTITVSIDNDPATHSAGPWCPGNIADDAEQGGIWPEGDEIYDVDGSFVENMATFYDDSAWQMYDLETGEINVTEDAEECAAAARPDVDPELANHCVQCLSSYMDEGSQLTYTIPLEPVDSETTIEVSGQSGVGLALNGVKFEPSAPTEAILGAYTLAPFDDCGGHINLNVGYHYHAITGCEVQVDSVGDHAPLIGFAMDGYPLHTQLDVGGTEPSDLDECRGHESEELGYHYHANDPGANETLTCFKAEYGCSELSTDGSEVACDASAVVAEVDEEEVEDIIVE